MDEIFHTILRNFQKTRLKRFWSVRVGRVGVGGGAKDAPPPPDSSIAWFCHIELQVFVSSLKISAKQAHPSVFDIANLVCLWNGPSATKDSPPVCSNMH